MNVDLAYLLGALRDGSVYYYKGNRSYYTLFYQKHKNWLEESIGKRIDKIFNVKYRIDEYKKGQYRLRISSKKLYKLWRTEYNFPGEGQSQKNWLVPKQIIKGAEEEKIAYIKAFFDTEGDVSPISSNTNYIGFSQKNVLVINQLKQLLNEIKIITTEPHIIDKKSKTYRISIVQKYSIKRYIDKIYSEHPVKKRRLEKLRIINK